MEFERNMKEVMLEFLDLDQAMNLTREQNRKNHRNFVNPELVNLMGLLKFDRCFIKAEGTSIWGMKERSFLIS